MSEKTDNIIHGITQKIVDAMKNDPDGWTKPWQGVGRLPYNAQSGNTYTGGNALVLMWLSPDPSDARWSTYKGWAKLGGQVRAGEKGTGIVYFSQAWFNKDTNKWSSKPMDGEGWEKKGMLKAYSIFHASQVDNAPAKPEQPVVSEDIDVQVHREWFQTLGADWRETPSDRAFYSPSEDYINTPEDTQFESPEGWFGVVAHEFTHWTGHTSRLDRKDDWRGDRGVRNEYAFEELVAELGATFLSVIRGVETDPRPDHARYINSWLKALDSDPKFIWDAAGKASKALNYILENVVEAPALAEV